jgi:integrase
MGWIHARHGVWQVKVSIEGKKYYHSLGVPVTTAKPPQSVIRAALDYEYLLRGGGGSQPITWRQAVQQHIEAKAGKDRHSRHSALTRKKKLQLFLDSIEADKKIPSDVRQAKAVIGGYLDARAAKWEPGTVRGDQRYISILCTWLRKADKVGWPYNPASATLHDMPEPHEHDPETYSSEDLQRLWLAVRDIDGLRWIYLLMLECGLRTGEAVRTRRRDMDRLARILRVPSRKNKRAGRVPLNSRILQELTDCRRDQLAASSDGTAWSDEGLRDAWNAAVDGAGLPKRFHSTYALRRTCISRYLQAGGPPTVGARIFDHHISTMMKFYAKLEIEQAAGFMDPAARGGAAGCAAEPLVLLEGAGI